MTSPRPIESLLQQREEASRDKADLFDFYNRTWSKLMAEVERLSEFESTSPRGYEAEELRSGIEELMRDEPGGDIESNHEWKSALTKLLDRVDARDSLSVVVERDELRKKLDAIEQRTVEAIATWLESHSNHRYQAIGAEIRSGAWKVKP